MRHLSFASLRTSTARAFPSTALWHELMQFIRVLGEIAARVDHGSCAPFYLKYCACVLEVQLHTLCVAASRARRAFGAAAQAQGIAYKFSDCTTHFVKL